MKNIKYLFFLLLLLTPVILSACGDANVSTGSATQSQEIAKGAISWPSQAPAGQQVALASNLLTKNYYIVQDGSGSMRESACKGGGSRSAVSKQALAEFAKSVPADANLGLLTFDNRGVVERVPLGSGFENRKAFIDRVNEAGPNGGTPLYSAVKLAYQRIEEQARRQLGYGEYYLVVVTDGEANPGESPREIVDYMLANSPVVLYTIGFCIGDKHSLNQSGKTIYKEAGDLESLRQGLKEVLAESPAFDSSFK